MPKVNINDGYVSFRCPGCRWFGDPLRDDLHTVVITGSYPWQFNGDVERPTLSPSVLVTGTERCHSFVRDGMIQFLDDCSHDKRGQTLPLPEWRTPSDDSLRAAGVGA